MRKCNAMGEVETDEMLGQFREWTPAVNNQQDLCTIRPYSQSSAVVGEGVVLRTLLNLE